MHETLDVSTDRMWASMHCALVICVASYACVTSYTVCMVEFSSEFVRAMCPYLASACVM